MSREESNEATNKVGPQSIYLSISAEHKRQKKKKGTAMYHHSSCWTGRENKKIKK
jgi:hypothetical protein